MSCSVFSHRICAVINEIEKQKICPTCFIKQDLCAVNVCGSSSTIECKWWGDIDERRGLRSQGRWWRIEQKRPCTARNSSLSSSPLKAVMGGGSLKWVATAKSIIFEMLSHKSLGPAYNLVSCFNVIRRHKLVCLIVCHLPAKWAASQPDGFDCLSALQ